MAEKGKRGYLDESCPPRVGDRPNGLERESPVMQHNSARHTHRLRHAIDARRTRNRNRREIASVLAGNHGSTVRNELLAMLEGR